MNKFFEKIELKVTNPREYSSVTLAYIGDSVFELYIRTYLLKNGNMKSGKLHKKAIKYVSAKAQAQILDSIHDRLTEDEKYIVNTARNQKPVSVPKNTEISEYIKATAFEALIGYLYLDSEYERMEKILDISVKEED